MINKFLKKDTSGNWNLIPAAPENELNKINCHKFVLFVLGLISKDEMFSDPKVQKETDPSFDFTFGKKAFAISKIEFEPIANPKELIKLAEEKCQKGKPYIGQILDSETGEMAHSFVVERTPDGKFLCFDKAGFKRQFGQYELGDLFKFENYHNQKWRFVPIS